MAELTRTPLKRGYIIDGYRIEKVIGGGGFSLVYLAYNIRTKAKVVIKEYFPEHLVDRIPGGRVVTRSEKDNLPYTLGIKRFFQEASALSQLKHPNIVNVSNFFRLNNTVYMVMDYAHGRDLRWFIKRAKGNMSERFMLSVFPHVLAGLNELHTHNFLHLDVKPANILLRADAPPLLLDFGAVQRMEQGMRYAGVQTLTHGFAPLEQYEEGDMGPWSDLYAVGATMYTCVTGRAPAPAPERRKKDSLVAVSRNYSRRYSKQLLMAIEWALELDYRYRPQDVQSFVRLVLDGQPESWIQESWSAVGAN